MAEPTRYERGFSFTGFQATQPNKPLPGTSVDAELDDISAAVGSAVSAINDIRREDGALRNGIVGPEALAPGLSTGVTPAVEWAPTVSFTANDTAYFDGAFYRCLQSHVSADFATDLALGRWLRYANIGGIVDDVFLARDQAEAAKVLAVAAEAAATPAAATAVAAAGTATDRYELFDDRYLGEKTSLPAVDNDGNPLVDGTLVSLTAQVNPLNDGMYVRRSGAWQFALAPFLGAFTSFRFVATASQTTFTGADAAGATLAYSPGAVIVTLNGATLAPTAYTATTGNSIVLGAAATSGDTLVIFSLGTFSVADVWSRLESDLRYFNASNLSSGTVANARLPSRLQSTGNFDTTGTGSFGGVVSGANATADGHLLNRGTANGLYAPLASAIVGEIICVAMNTAPAGTLKCNGAAVSRTTYAALFAAIGTTYGAGDGSTTFNLPELRGEFVRGWDDGRGVDSGRAIGSTQTDAFQGHAHDSNTFNAGFNVVGGGISVIRPFGAFETQGPVSDGTNGTPRTAAETRPRNVALLYCIRF
jgi:hypothetical protein